MINFGIQKAGQVGLVVATGVAIGIAIASQSVIALAFVGSMIVIAATVGALVFPERAFVVLVLLLALIPPYAAPEVGHLLFMPAAGAAWILAGVLAWRWLVLDGGPFRATAVDIAVGAFALLMATSVAFSPQENVSSYLEVAFFWGGVYLAARLLLRETRRPVFLVAASFALVTVIVAPVAILETVGKSNPFLALQFNPVESAVWAKQADRLGQVRAETSFGHPIALSMFAATSAFLSLAMAIHTERLRARFAWFGLAMLAVGVQVLTLTRTGWVMLTLGVIIFTLATARKVARRRLRAILVVLALMFTTMFAINALPSQLQLFSDSSGATTPGGAEVANSEAGRNALLNRALQPGVLQAWGSPVNRVTPAVSSIDSIDNEYILLAEEWGLIPMVAFVLVGLTLLPVILSSRTVESGSMAALPIAAFTALVGLFFVAFITQQQLMIWLLLGASGAVAERTGNVSKTRQPPPISQRRSSRTTPPPSESWDAPTSTKIA